MDSPLCVRRMASASTGAMSSVFSFGHNTFLSSCGHVLVVCTCVNVCCAMRSHLRFTSAKSYHERLDLRCIELFNSVAAQHSCGGGDNERRRIDCNILDVPCVTKANTRVAPASSSLHSKGNEKIEEKTLGRKTDLSAARHKVPQVSAMSSTRMATRSYE